MSSKRENRRGVVSAVKKFARFVGISSEEMSLLYAFSENPSKYSAKMFLSDVDIIKSKLDTSSQGLRDEIYRILDSSGASSGSYAAQDTGLYDPSKAHSDLLTFSLITKERLHDLESRLREKDEIIFQREKQICYLERDLQDMSDKGSQ
ncbi:MAG: hypothetical protein KC506_02345 [Nanoarchaeota archaeon]|nr:hypothetical protein [Nanoarchaeota archaeon]